jgi:hypothetical protein
MNHPFNRKFNDLEPQELEFEEQLTEEEAEKVGGAYSVVTTLAIGEEGGYGGYPKPYPRPIAPPMYPPIDYPMPMPKQPKPEEPPVYTTMALGEEGGDFAMM